MEKHMKRRYYFPRLLLPLLFSFMSVTPLPAFQMVSDRTTDIVGSTVKLSSNVSGYDSFFVNPAALAFADEDIGFIMDTWVSSDVRTTELFINPRGEVFHIAQRLQTLLLDGGYDEVAFWRENSALVEELRQLDANFPNLQNPITQYDIDESIRPYFETYFMDSDYGAARWGQAIIAFSKTDLFSKADVSARRIAGGNLSVGLSLGTSHIHQGFGWALRFMTQFYTPPSLLDDDGGSFGLSLTMPIGYAFHISPRIVLGFVVRTGFNVMTPIPGKNVLDARFRDDFVSLFGEPFYFGASIYTDIGLLFQQDGASRFSVVLRGIPSVEFAVSTPLTELAKVISWQMPTFSGEPIYCGSMDIAVGYSRQIQLWQFPGMISVEVSDILSQLLLRQEQRFLFENIVKLDLDVQINSRLTGMIGYADQFLHLGVTGTLGLVDLSVTISGRIFRFEAGPSFGVNFRMAF